MAREQQDRVSAERHAVVVRDDYWLIDRGNEPSLNELLEDPIMDLLWRADGLDPITARATVMDLQALMLRMGTSLPDEAGSKAVDSRCLCDLAA